MLGTIVLLKALAHRRWAMARIFAAAEGLSDEQYYGSTSFWCKSLLEAENRDPSVKSFCENSYSA